MKIAAQRALFAASVCVIASLLPASAQASDFQQYLNGACPGLLCKIDFKTVPAGKTLEIMNTSCYVRAHSGASLPILYAVQLVVVRPDSSAASAVTLGLPPGVVDSFGPVPIRTFWQTNDQIFAFATAGQHMQAYVQLTAGVFEQVACHISGKLLP